MAKPHTLAYLRSVGEFIESVREDTGEVAPLHSMGLPGVRLHYGLLESA